MKEIKRKMIAAFYPLLMKLMQRLGKNTLVLENKTGELFQTPIYTLPLLLNNGTETTVANWKGKKLLLVNTASDCGYTAQYAELQALQDRYKDKLQIIGFPANDFRQQEKGSDAAIAQFCQVNFGVTFPLAKRTSVVKGAQQNAVYQWLTQKDKNGWNDKAPGWNFSKYLVNENGNLTHYFDPAISPLGPEIIQAIEP